LSAGRVLVGHHYVPQYYLKGFSPDGKSIWAFDKEDGRAFRTQVKSIANETGFYSADVEIQLANSVEEPANVVLKAIRERQRLSQADRVTLSAYMVCLLKRVPRGKEWGRELAPGVLQETIEGIQRQLDDLERREPERRELWERRRAELAAMPEGFEDDVVQNAWLENLGPDVSSKSVTALSRMTWQFLTVDRYPAFLASDNPVFHFRDIGIANPASEVSFPISSHVALWATWRSDLEEGYFPVRESWVAQINRRSASVATRYLFHAKEEEWALRLLCKSRWSIGRLT
jgi:Protein of unknown function (DUF4238)